MYLDTFILDVDCWLDIFIYYKMITTIALANTSIILHHYHSFFVVRTFQMYSLGNFHVYNIILVIIITMLTRSPELTPLITESLCLLTNISPFPPSLNPWWPFYVRVSMSLIFLDSTCKWSHAVFTFSLWLISLRMSSRFIHAMNGRISF